MLHRIWDSKIADMNLYREDCRKIGQNAMCLSVIVPLYRKAGKMSECIECIVSIVTRLLWQHLGGYMGINVMIHHDSYPPVASHFGSMMTGMSNIPRAFCQVSDRSCGADWIDASGAEGGTCRHLVSGCWEKSWSENRLPRKNPRVYRIIVIIYLMTFEGTSIYPIFRPKSCH